MALHIEATIKGKTHRAEWHFSEPMPEFVFDANVVKFQADGDELDALLVRLQMSQEELYGPQEPTTIEGVLTEKKTMRILIADDDQDVRDTLQALLELDGHTVVACRDGSAALRTYIEDGPFDRVVTDYQMPSKNGLVLIMDIRQRNPEQRVVLVSGDPPQVAPHIKKLTGEFPILAKPYRTAALLELLK